MRMKLAQFGAPILLSAAVGLTGCVGLYAHKGAVLDPQLVSSIQPGVDNKASVEKLLGQPTFDGQFNDNDWYYVSRDTKQIGFRNPRTQKETVLHVRFDQAGNVIGVAHSGKELASNIDPSKRSTPTLGRKRSFFDEIFGNISTVGAPGIPSDQNGPGGY
jgi:outer membrane protein assembly factor BamE (lipoprotein component of BamABCDE complex)